MPTPVEIATARLMQAMQLHSDGQFGEAETQYRQLLHMQFAEGQVLCLLGLLCFQTNRPAQSISLFDQGLQIDPTYRDAYQNFAMVLKRLGQLQRALDLLDQGLARFPAAKELLLLASHYSILAANYPRAIVHNRAMVANDPEDFISYSNLCTAYFFVGQIEPALEYGRQALTVRDRVYQRDFAPVANAPRRVVEPLSVECPRQSEQVIAFSLWGNHRTYLQGALHNAQLALELYPDWVCRFYCDATVPLATREQLVKQGAQVYLMPPSHDFTGTFWRFFVADDPQVKRFLCRDCDSRLNTQEQAAVQAWIASGQPFHIMRDAIVHCDLILAGLWGGVTGRLPHLQSIYQRVSQPTEKGADQRFLGAFVWPLIKDISLTHDTYYRFHNGQPFPESGRLIPPQHVGAGIEFIES